MTDFPTLRCGTCRFPVEPGEAWLWIDTQETTRVLEAIEEFERAHPHGYSASELFSEYPEHTHWMISHDRCAADHAGVYDIKLPTTYRDLLRTASDLLEKRWMRATDLQHLMREAADLIVRFAPAR